MADDLGITSFLRRHRVSPMAGLAALAVVIVLAALLAMVVMGRESDRTRACWAERQAIAAEMQVWAAMDAATVHQRLNLPAYVTQSAFYRAREITRLEASMPDC